MSFFPNNIYFSLFIFFIQILVIFFISRKTTSLFFSFFNRIFRNQKLTFLLITLIFFPGTIIHELSHYFCAMILFLNIKEIKILPEFNNNQIELGHVLYYKKDFVRGLIVGIAPFFGALLFFFFISYFHFFPSQNLWQNLFFAYLIFAVSSTMFSSKEDLIDITYLIPLFLITSAVIYVFDIKIDFIIQNQKIVQLFSNFLSQVNSFFLMVIFIHLVIMLTLKLFKS